MKREDKEKDAEEFGKGEKKREEGKIQKRKEGPENGKKNRKQRNLCLCSIFEGQSPFGRFRSWETELLP